MNKKFMILTAVFFALVLVTGGYDLYPGSKDCTKCPGCGPKAEKAKECTHETVYKCPMKECNYTSDKDGKCPNCGMALEKTDTGYVYKCTSEGCTFTSDKEGKCPMCKTDLKKVKCDAHKEHVKKEKVKKDKSE